MNVAGTETVALLLGVPGGTLRSRVVPLLARPGYELGAFLSLVTDFLSKIPAITPRPVEMPPSAASRTQAAPVTIKDKSKSSAGHGSEKSTLNSRKAVSPSNNLRLATEGYKGRESAAQPSVGILQEPVGILLVASHVTSLPVPRPESDRVDGQITPAQHPDIEPPSTSPLPALSPAPTRAAFTLRLTPIDPESQNSSRVSISSLPALVDDSNPGPSPRPAQETLSSSSEPISVSSSPPLARAIERPGPTVPAFNVPITNPAQLRFEPGPKPLKDGPGHEVRPAASVAADAQGKQSFGPLPESSPAPVPADPEPAIRWSWPVSPKQSPEEISAPAQDPRVIPDEQLQTKPNLALSPGISDALVHQPDPTPKMIPGPSPRPSPVPESGISQTDSKGSNRELAGKPAIAASQFTFRQVEGNATAVEAPVRPTGAESAPGTRTSRPPSADTHAITSASEPQIRVGIAPAIRQISLKLSADESTRVNVDLTAKAGKIQVSVRTLDPELAKSLQTDLGDLVGRLESKGFKTEAWVPASTHQITAPSQPSDSNTGFGQPQHPGSGPGGGQERQQQNGSNQRQQARWTAQMEETLSKSEARSESQ